MKRKERIMARRLLQLVLIALLLFFGVLSWNYLTFSSRQLRVQTVSLQTLDSPPIFERLVEAIKVRTVSSSMSRINNDHELVRFREYLQESFPSLHATPFICRTGKDFGDERCPSLLLEWPGEKPELDAMLLMSHFDVVPVEDGSLGKWTHPPFSGKIDDEFVWGRGTLDCKHGVMAILEAIRLLSAEGFKPQRTIYVALGHDEEMGGADGNSKMAAWFRSHRKRFSTILDEGGCVFTKFPGLARPAALVGVAEKGFLTVAVTANVNADQVGHSSMPPRETAVSILSSAIHRVTSNPFPARLDGGIRETLNFLGPEMPFFQKLAMSNLWLFAPHVKGTLGSKPSGDALLRTTIAPTLIEGGVSETVLPTQATAKINLRLLPGDSIESSLDFLQRSINDPRVSSTPLNKPREASPV